MDGENNGKPYLLMDDLGVTLFLETPHGCFMTGFRDPFFMIHGSRNNPHITG